MHVWGMINNSLNREFSGCHKTWARKVFILHWSDQPWNTVLWSMSMSSLFWSWKEAPYLSSHWYPLTESVPSLHVTRRSDLRSAMTLVWCTTITALTEAQWTLVKFRKYFYKLRQALNLWSSFLRLQVAGIRGMRNLDQEGYIFKED